MRDNDWSGGPDPQQDHNTGIPEKRGKEIHFATTKTEVLLQIPISQCSPYQTPQENICIVLITYLPVVGTMH